MLLETMKRPGNALVAEDCVGGGLWKRQRQDEDREGLTEDLGGGDNGDAGPQHPTNNNTTSLPSSLSLIQPPEIVIVDEQDIEQTVDDDASDSQSDGLFLPHLAAESRNATSSLASTPINGDSTGLICYGMVGNDNELLFLY